MSCVPAGGKQGIISLCGGGFEPPAPYEQSSGAGACGGVCACACAPSMM